MRSYLTSPFGPVCVVNSTGRTSFDSQHTGELITLLMIICKLIYYRFKDYTTVTSIKRIIVLIFGLAPARPACKGMFGTRQLYDACILLENELNNGLQNSSVKGCPLDFTVGVKQTMT